MFILVDEREKPCDWAEPSDNVAKQLPLVSHLGSFVYHFPSPG